MSFSSPGFIFIFLPFFFACYFAVPGWLRNGVLLVGSLAFYSMDGVAAAAVLVASIIVNYLLGRAIEVQPDGKRRDGFLALGIVLNLLPLIYYKYFNFLITATNDARALAWQGAPISLADILLPAGISFFTFQGLSYLIDLYRREARSAPSVVDFGMYHTLFPQLVAGPIVRYREVQQSIVHRAIRATDVEQGIFRFSIGLAKKIVIADSMGVVADHVFSGTPGQLTAAAAWVGVLAYTLQIFFDFSGYSDMAIGLGRALGFRFPENFDQPYRSLSITEFWRRWHMTLSRWFRDYVYIPLGGNRRGSVRTYFNLVIVFVLCGLWHGAAYTFLVWGLYHGALLVVERAGGGALLARLPAILSWAVTLLLVMIGWVFFRAGTLSHAVEFLQAMAGFGRTDALFDLSAVLTVDKISFLAIGIGIAVWPGRGGLRSGAVGTTPVEASGWLRQIATLALFVYSAALIASNGFNPFIYFRF